MKRFLFILTSLLLIAACRPDDALKGFDNFQIALNSDIFNYRVYLTIKDEKHQPIPNAKFKVLGSNAAYIFTEFGSRDFETNEKGEIVLALHPSYEPGEGTPLEFNISLNMNQYEQGVRRLVIEKYRYSSYKDLGFWSLDGLNSLGVKFHKLSAINGALTSQNILNKQGAAIKVLNKTISDTVYYDEFDAAILLKAGTKFTYLTQEVISEEVTYTYKKPIYAYSIAETFDTIEVNGVMVVAKKEEEVRTHQGDSTWTKTGTKYKTVTKTVPYTGNDIEIQTLISYEPFYNPPYRLSNDHDYYSYLNYPNQNLNGVATGGIIPARKFIPATKATSSWARFTGKLDDGSIVTLLPDSSAIFSFVIDPAVKNPQTNQPVKEGDILDSDRFFWDHNKGEFITERVVVKKAGNGQLRIQTATFPSYGYYDFYTREEKFTANFTAGVPDKSIIPDHENLNYEVEVRFVYNGNSNILLYEKGSANQFNSNFNKFYKERTIYHDGSLGSPHLDYYLYTDYWKKDKWRKYIYRNNLKNIDQVLFTFYSDPSFIINPITTYDVSVICAANDSVKLYPTASASADGGYIYLKNGKWATKAFALGDTMSMILKYKNWSLDSSFVLKELHNPLEIVDRKNLDICDL